MQSWDDQDKDAAALVALGVGGPKLLQALSNAGYLPSYDTGRRHVDGARLVRPNEPAGLPWLPEALGHIPGCHVWHLCIDEIHVEDVITVSGEAHAVGLCATRCWHPMPRCGNAPFRDRHGYLLSADTDHDARRSREMQAALYAEGASTLSWMPEMLHIPFQTDDFGMWGNFDRPPLMKRVSHMLGGISLVLQGELSYGVL